MAMDFKQGLSRQITKINMKTSTFMEENKIKTYITTLENDIAELKRQSGELGYNLWAEGKLDGAKLAPFYQQVQEKYRQIQEQERLLQELEMKNRQVLGGSPARMPGAPASAAPGAAGQVICPHCGDICAPSMNFCKKCGMKLR
ncbi:MAG: zinc ribbon domain-containing protein [Lachnospiraceae bacterium]|nr:zinc ribbon domain-containing protein [Lachnospiraceae bacterium]MDO5549684.1 zinc ribbon domain-containing protein [Lachnospiraceae bacterium]